jgi:hypothetical protein
MDEQKTRMIRLLKIAKLAYAHWFFGNLYEAVARIPDHLSDKYEEGERDDRLPTIASQGSPVRYYVPGVPIVIGATLSALLAGWESRRDRPWLAAVAFNALTGLAVTVYLVPAVNLRLFVRGQPLTSADQQRLLKKWYRLNAVRLLAVGAAWLIAARILQQARE